MRQSQTRGSDACLWGYLGCLSVQSIALLPSTKLPGGSSFLMDPISVAPHQRGTQRCAVCWVALRWGGGDWRSERWLNDHVSGRI